MIILMKKLMKIGNNIGFNEYFQSMQSLIDYS